MSLFRHISSAGVLGVALFAASAPAQTAPMTPDIPPTFTPPHIGYDYVKRVEMIPMRDGVKLYTVMIIPKGAHNAPIVLTRTPYDAAKRAQSTGTPYRDVALAHSDEWMTDEGYIRVF